ncbi:MAG: Crp/Fnr family transcriptional regulator [Atopobiaceae bacterium]|nr:Crp/Fnr family transcriptional regulator [Atopobiaceae bacterium]
MDYSTLRMCSLFAGIPEEDIRDDLDAVPHRIQRYGKGEAVFRLMDPANRAGIVLSGRVQAQKPFPNGSQVNVSARSAGETIGPAAAFSKSGRYPCDVVALEPSAVLMLRKADLLTLMQRDARIMGNLMSELATATYMLQQRLELLSYGGIAQKAAFYLLMQVRQSRQNLVAIPGTVSNWAMLMNVSRPSLHRELRRLEAAGAIAYHPPTIEIRDATAPRDMLGR